MNGHNRLVRRQHTYYLRARIPTNLVYLIHKSQFWYSLKTNNYHEALEKISKESYKVDMKINLLRALDMKIKNKHLLFEQGDIDKIVINKLKQVEYVFENYFDEIWHRQYDYNDLLIFNKKSARANTNLHKLACVELAVQEYFNDTLADERTHKATKKQIQRIQKEGIPIIEDWENPSENIKNISTALTGVEKYILDKIHCIEENIKFNRSLNPRIERCLEEIHAELNEKARRPTSSTSWRKVFDEFALDKLNNRTGQSTIEQNRQCLETIFEIIGKTHIEAIIYKDCQKVSRSLYNLPKKWKERYKGQKLSDLIAQPRNDAISLTSVKKYLRIFKEFLIYCKNNRYIPDSFQGDINISKRKEVVSIEPFTKEELKKIFNPKKYPRVKDKKYSYRYWIPLIALYTGMRLNEICQLFLDDIKLNKGIWYFYITDEGEKQHIKNPQSKRIVPIHQKLINLGILDYANQVRAMKNDRLFYQLNYSPKNHYIQAVSQWFGRYLKKLDITARSKVFHSFRHTVKPYLRDCGVPQEYQNAICGWIGKDIGERVYGGNVPIKKLYKEISKLNYPFLNRDIERIASKNKIKGK